MEAGSADAPELPIVEKAVVEATPPRSFPYQFLTWTVLSGLTILFNAWLIVAAGFRYPVLLACIHLTFTAVTLHLLGRTTSLLDERRSTTLTGRKFLRAVVPIAILHAASIICSNVAYTSLSVSYIQMLKASSPAVVLILSWLRGQSNPSLRVLLSALAIVVGVVLSSLGESDFQSYGFFIQMAAIFAEAIRGPLVLSVLSDDTHKMDPIACLYYSTPVSAAATFFVACLTELRHFQADDLAKVGLFTLFLSAVVALLLNASSIFVVSNTPAPAVAATGVLKNFAVVILAAFMWSTPIYQLQRLGYSITLVAVVFYTLGWDEVVSRSSAAAAWAHSTLNSSTLDEGRMSPAVKRKLMITMVIAMLIMVFIGSSMPPGSSTHVVEK